MSEIKDQRTYLSTSRVGENARESGILGLGRLVVRSAKDGVSVRSSESERVDTDDSSGKRGRLGDHLQEDTLEYS